MTTFEHIENNRLHKENDELWDKVYRLEKYRLLWASIAIGLIIYNTILALWESI